MSRYKQLENSEMKPSSPNDKHLIANFVGGQKNPMTQHEIAYSRFKATNSTAGVVGVAKDLEIQRSNDGGNSHQKLMINQLDSVLIGSKSEPKHLGLFDIITNYN